MHHGVTRSLGGKQCAGVKCNPHGVDIPFFFCKFFAARRVFKASPYFFTKRRRSAVIAFLRGVPTKYFSPCPKNLPKNILGDLSMQNLV